jgi:hypothetical protein
VGGADPAERAAAAEVDDLLRDAGGGSADGALRDEIERLGRDRSRTAREAEADERLAALKRRMGK